MFGSPEWKGKEWKQFHSICLVYKNPLERAFQWNWVSTKMVELAFHQQPYGKAIPIPFNIFTSENTPLPTIAKKIKTLRKKFADGEKSPVEEGEKINNVVEGEKNRN